ncbi:MAG: hypothetical protein MUF49_18470 [Oculatellaceae cyanobacterium Prado106]|jgi:hypothetical protein|nr:hypothetical protein [Oculatellaceae cyanobacterium Prado106]
MVNVAPNPSQNSGVSSLGGLDVTPRLANLLEEYGEIAAIIPVLAGLFVTSRLRLRGSQALLVNLAIAALARQVILQLKKQVHHPPVTTASANGQSTASAPLSSVSTQSASNQSVSAQMVEDYTIVHSTLGRLRLRIPRLIGDAAYAKRLQKLLETEERVTRIRLNRSAASLVIQYDGMGVSELELGMRLLQILEQAEDAA